MFLYIIGYNNISWRPNDPSFLESGGHDPNPPGLTPIIVDSLVIYECSAISVTLA